jgi:fluoroacetyl-CoA thioesterase
MSTGDGLRPGLRAAVRATVTGGDTAIEAGSGDLPVLATPRLLALAEAATVAIAAPRLPPGQTSVGVAVELAHRRPSPVGAQVLVEAELTEIDGTRLTFAVTARAGGGSLIGMGTVQRAVVDRARFIARLAGGG